MTRGIPGSEPDGQAGEVFWMMGMFDVGADLTIADLEASAKRLAADVGDDEEPLTRQQIQIGLVTLAGRQRPLVSSSKPGTGHPATWRITPYGRRMVAIWDGDDPGPERVPCGLGWPPP